MNQLTNLQKQESDAVRLEMALSESAKEVNVQSNNGMAKSSLVDLTAAAKSLKDPWGGKHILCSRNCYYFTVSSCSIPFKAHRNNV